MLAGKEIVLGVTGGIAVYKAVELVRLLVRKGASVQVVMTKNAQQFVTPLTFQTLSKHPVIIDMFELSKEVDIKHISLARRADLVLIAPATANIIGKYAQGIADDFLSTMLLATTAPVFIAPAMNPEMYSHPIVQRNLTSLEKMGVKIIPPGRGDTACEEIGLGRLADLEVILTELENFFAPKKDLEGQIVLVTAGPTQEPLDPIRYITNPSSGKMGYALARASKERGAQVILISGPTHLTPPRGVTFFPVRTAREMYEIVLREMSKTTIIIKAAAVADYQPKTFSPQKIKKGMDSGTELVLHLEKTPDILTKVGSMKGDKILVGFAAETESLLDNARHKLMSKNLDLIIANNVTLADVGFGSDSNKVNILYRDGRVEELPLLPKDQLSHLILDRIVEIMKEDGR
jgi:phosphopantothenoylcysteine decarboxylase/phosphopantothenate--cysteine ligase